MNNFPADFYTIQTGMNDVHTKECENQEDGLKCICDETIDIGDTDHIDMVEVHKPDTRWIKREEPF